MHPVNVVQHFRKIVDTKRPRLGKRKKGKGFWKQKQKKEEKHLAQKTLAVKGWS